MAPGAGAIVDLVRVSVFSTRPHTFSRLSYQECTVSRRRAPVRGQSSPSSLDNFDRNERSLMSRRVNKAEKNGLSPGDISASSSSRRVNGRKWRYEDTAAMKRHTAGVSRRAKSSSRGLTGRDTGITERGKRRNELITS